MDLVIHNMAHHPKTRHIRASAPVHPRHKQFILKTQRRLIPNRPITVNEDELIDNFEQLQSLEAQGIIEVRTTSGELVVLKTRSIIPGTPESPRPRFRLDSAQNDPPRGKSSVFQPDTTEPINVHTGEHSGGGMTAEAMVQADEDQKLPPLPDELKHLEEDLAPHGTVETRSAVTSEEMAGAFAEEPVDEEADITQEDAPKAKPRSRRHR